MTLKKKFITLLVNLLHYREVLPYWLVFITLSGSITYIGSLLHYWSKKL